MLEREHTFMCVVLIVGRQQLLRAARQEADTVFAVRVVCKAGSYDDNSREKWLKIYRSSSNVRERITHA